MAKYRRPSPIPDGSKTGAISFPAEERCKVAVQLSLEILREHGRTRRLARRSRLPQRLAELLEIQLHQAEGALPVEDGQQDEAAFPRRHRREEDLPLLPRMVEDGERLSVEVLAELPRGCVDRGGERAGGHDVHGAREAMLREHLAARVEQEREEHARLGDEVPQRTLDPLFGDGDRHPSVSSARSISMRSMPTFERGSASVTSTRSFRPTAHTRPRSASSWRKVAVPTPAASAERRARR